jgi:hypothetical protein
LAKDGNSIKPLEADSEWSESQNISKVNSGDYLFEIAFIKYTEPDASGENTYQLLHGAKVIGRFGVDSDTLVLDNDSDVVVVSPVT